MATAKIRGRKVVWGIVPGSTDTQANAILTRIRHGKTGQEDTVPDFEGFTIAEIFYDNTDEIEVDVLCEVGTVMPDRGDDITIAGLTGIVNSVEVVWENKAVKKLAIKARKRVNLVES